jgi:hypothetical protein
MGLHDTNGPLVSLSKCGFPATCFQVDVWSSLPVGFMFFHLTIEDGEISGTIRAELEAGGEPTSAYNLLIAGQAMRNKFTLITANLLGSARINVLSWADWGKP